MKTTLGENLFTVSGILTRDECRTLIERGESIGFEKAAVRTVFGPKMRSDIRDNDRAPFTDPELAASLWERCRTFVPPELEGGEVVGLDAAFRFYRYDSGQQFKRHKDGTVERSLFEWSRLTCLFYLNEEFTGGETVFYSDESFEGDRPEVARVTPRSGSALFFLHEWWHGGRTVVTGRKYVLRSDLFYAFRVGSGSGVTPSYR